MLEPQQMRGFLYARASVKIVKRWRFMRHILSIPICQRFKKGSKGSAQTKTPRIEAEAMGESVNAMVARAILADMGLTEWPSDDPQK